MKSLADRPMSKLQRRRGSMSEAEMRELIIQKDADKRASAMEMRESAANLLKIDTFLMKDQFEQKSMMKSARITVKFT